MFRTRPSPVGDLVKAFQAAMFRSFVNPHLFPVFRPSFNSVPVEVLICVGCLPELLPVILLGLFPHGAPLPCPLFGIRFHYVPQINSPVHQRPCDDHCVGAIALLRQDTSGIEAPPDFTEQEHNSRSCRGSHWRRRFRTPSFNNIEDNGVEIPTGPEFRLELGPDRLTNPFPLLLPCFLLCRRQPVTRFIHNNPPCASRRTPCVHRAPLL